MINYGDIEMMISWVVFGVRGRCLAWNVCWDILEVIYPICVWAMWIFFDFEVWFDVHMWILMDWDMKYSVWEMKVYGDMYMMIFGVVLGVVGWCLCWIACKEI